MPTVISHPVVLLALRPAFRLPASVYICGAFCSILPDVDVLGFRYGIQYGDLFGHRGFTHSLFFAGAISALLTVLIALKQKRLSSPVFLFLFLCTVSHGILDAFTDGGLGVAFFSPFSNVRYFFPWRPLRVSPIGIGHFLSGPVLSVLGSEFLFIWLPCVAIFFVSFIRKKRRLKPSLNNAG
jgi:inner membrane protein